MQKTCEDILGEVVGTMGCMVIDMGTGLTVAAGYRPGTVMNSAALDLVAVVSANIFRGTMVQQVKKTLADPSSGSVREAYMATTNANQFMSTIPGWDEGLLVLVTDKSVNVGMGWMTVHQAVARFTPPPAVSGTTDRPSPARGQVAQVPRAAEAPSPATNVEVAARGGAEIVHGEPSPASATTRPPVASAPAPAEASASVPDAAAAPGQPKTEPQKPKERKKPVVMGPRARIFDKGARR